jgi:hypothetical protein
VRPAAPRRAAVHTYAAATVTLTTLDGVVHKVQVREWEAIAACVVTGETELRPSCLRVGRPRAALPRWWNPLRAASGCLRDVGECRGV